MHFQNSFLNKISKRKYEIFINTLFVLKENNNIINKKYSLPSRETCIESIQKYTVDNVINNIENILKKYVENFSR